MLKDLMTTFADQVALNTATGLNLVGSQIPLSVARDIGNLRDSVWVVIIVDTAITSSAGASVAFVLLSDDTAAIAVNGTATEHYRTAATPKATLVAGYQFAFALPMEGPPYELFLGLAADVSTTALTAGKINAFLHDGPPPGWKALDANVSA